MKKVVIFGGGTGLSYILESLKILQLDLTVVVATADNGGSTGKIRKMYEIPAMGDIRRAVIALANQSEVEELMNFRFDEKMDKHTIGNLILTALSEITGDFEEAVLRYCKLLGVDQKIYPVSSENINFSAEMKNGAKLKGESEITKYNSSIKKIFYEQEYFASSKVINAVNEADFIIYSSGSLYSSIISNLIFPNMMEALNKTKAKKIYISNLMTEYGETHKYDLFDHITAFHEHLGENALDYVFANTNYVMDDWMLEKYECEKAEFVKYNDKCEKTDVKIIKNNYLHISKDEHIRHNINRILVDFLNVLEEVDEIKNYNK